MSRAAEAIFFAYATTPLRLFRRFRYATLRHTASAIACMPPCFHYYAISLLLMLPLPLRYFHAMLSLCRHYFRHAAAIVLLR